MDGIGAIELPLKGFGGYMVLKPKSYLNQNPYHCKDAVMLACDYSSIMMLCVPDIWTSPPFWLLPPHIPHSHGCGRTSTTSQCRERCSKPRTPLMSSLWTTFWQIFRLKRWIVINLNRTLILSEVLKINMMVYLSNNAMSWLNQVRLEVTWRDVGIRLKPLSARMRYKVLPLNGLQLHLRTQYYSDSNEGLGWGGSGGGDRAHVSSIDGAMELERLLPQWGSLQTEVHLHVKNRRQTSWGEESFSRRGGHHRQLNGAYKVSKNNLIIIPIDPDSSNIPIVGWYIRYWSVITIWKTFECSMSGERGAPSPVLPSCWVLPSSWVEFHGLAKEWCLVDQIKIKFVISWYTRIY